MGLSAIQRAARRTAVMGVGQALAGCVMGFLPGVVKFAPAAVAAHIEFCVNGTLQARLLTPAAGDLGSWISSVGGQH